jgi:hypothetical protein
VSAKKGSDKNIVVQQSTVEVVQEVNNVEVNQEFTVVDVYTTVGAKGRSAYDLWIEAGNSGTVEEFLQSLVGGNHTHNQMVPSDNWVIEHNLGFFPNVTVFSSADEQVFGDITHISINKLSIQFSGALSGKAHLS